MHSQTINTAIDMNKVDDSDIKEAVAEVNTTKSRVAQLILRATTNGFSSRTESGQANVGFIGGVQRGMISSNSRTSAIRKAFGALVPLSNIFEVQGVCIAEETFKRIRALAPEAPLSLIFDLARITAFVGVSGSKLTSGMKKYVEARDARIELFNRVQNGENVSIEEQELIQRPWQDVIEVEDTGQTKSILDIEEIAKLAQTGLGGKNKNKRLSNLSFNDLAKEVAAILDRSRSKPALASAAFGAMQADLPNASVFGGVSVNHAFTTGPAQIKQSFWTLVGDSKEGQSHAGAAGMGTRELSSGVFVESALTDIPQMRSNLSYMTSSQFNASMTGIYRGLLTVTPNGGQRAHLTRALPEFVVHVISSLQPLSFESAFVKPIELGTEDGDMITSAQQLVNHLVDFKCFAGEIGRDYQIILLGTPTVMAALENIPEDWIVVKSMDELIEVTNQLTGV